MTFTTRSLDYFGSSSTWGDCAGESYYLEALLSEVWNRVTGGLDYTHRDWTCTTGWGIRASMT
jgi:hypothetical protein